MLDRYPEEKDDPRAWFLYFRMTKHLPGMPVKFEQEMKRAGTAEAARMVLTAYTSAALDVVFFCGFRSPRELASELEDTFHLKPSHLMLLNVKDIAAPLKVSADETAERLRQGGFSISESGTITGFERPAEAPVPRRRQSAPRP